MNKLLYKNGQNAFRLDCITCLFVSGGEIVAEQYYQIVSRAARIVASIYHRMLTGYIVRPLCDAYHLLGLGYFQPLWSFTDTYLYTKALSFILLLAFCVCLYVLKCIVNFTFFNVIFIALFFFFFRILLLLFFSCVWVRQSVGDARGASAHCTRLTFGARYVGTVVVVVVVE